MSVTIDVFIKFKGSKKELIKILNEDFLVAVGKKQYWFLSFIELGLSTRVEDDEYFVGHRFRPYNFVLGGSVYAWSSIYGTARDSCTIIMDTIAQILAIKLKTRTMVCVRDWGKYRRYRHIRPMKRHKFSAILDEKSGKPPKGFF